MELVKFLMHMCVCGTKCRSLLASLHAWNLSSSVLSVLGNSVFQGIFFRKLLEMNTADDFASGIFKISVCL